MQDAFTVRRGPDGKRNPAKTANPLLARSVGRLEPRDQVVQAKLLETFPHRVELARCVLDQLAALLAELECLAQAGLAGVELLDDLLDAGDRGLVARRLNAHLSTSSRTRAATQPSAMRSSKFFTFRTAAAPASGSPSR